MNINEGFDLNFRGVEFTMSNNNSLQILKINSNLKHFGMNMFTIVNNTINYVPITYRYLNSTSKTNKFTDIFLNNIEENEENLISFKFSHTPLTDVNSTIELKLNCINLIYHQTFISRCMRFFTTQGQFEDLKNNVMESYKSFKKQTQSMVTSNITKKNNIKVKISPRKILIPINKYDIKNSKMLVWEMGQGGIDTSNNLEINDPKNIYDKHYTVDLGAISLRCYENVKGFKTTGVSTKNNKLFIEGIIKFDSGNIKETQFVFESLGKGKFEGYNKQISRGKKTYKLNSSKKGGKLVCESLNYNYRSRNELNESVRVYGTVRKK
jgi:hypothetical protein